MNTELIVRAVAGILISAGITLALWIDINWLILPAFVGVNLLQSAFSKFCPLEVLLKKSLNNNNPS